MPTATPQAVRKQIAAGTIDPIYLIVGDDDAEMARLAAELSAIVEDELRAFNLERMYAGEKGATPAAIVESARTLPMMGVRRVVVVLRAEKLLKPKRRGRAADEESADGEFEPGGGDLDLLDAYARKPEPLTTLVFVAADVDRSRKLYKSIQKSATIIECWGLKGSAKDPKDVKGWELERIAKDAAGIVTRLVKDAGYSVEQPAARLLAVRAGTDIATLRGDVERVLLYAGEKKTISLADVRDVVSHETLQDHWALSNAIVEMDAAKALKQLALAFEAGAVPYMILGQLGYCVREYVPKADARRLPAAVDALFRTDLDLKTSGGDPRVLLERLVVELCRR